MSIDSNIGYTANAIPNQAREIRRLAVYHDQLHFRMRDTETLDHVLYGSGHEEFLLQRPIPLARRQMIVQFCIKAKASTSRRESHNTRLSSSVGLRVACSGNVLPNRCH